MARAKAAANTEPTKVRAQLPHPLDFGAPATSDLHRFKAGIPEGSIGRIQISEHVSLPAASADSLTISCAPKPPENAPQRPENQALGRFFVRWNVGM